MSHMLLMSVWMIFSVKGCMKLITILGGGHHIGFIGLINWAHAETFHSDSAMIS